MTVSTLNIGDIKIANNLPFVLIAGPCQIESYDHSMFMAEALVNITSKLGIGFIYKSSFDKANRTSVKGKRGIGLEKSLGIFDAIKKEFNCPLVTDVHTAEQCEIVANHVDILQIPAFLCRQTDLIAAAAKTGRILNVKKGQFLAPWDMKNVFEKCQTFNAKGVMLTERGTCFGYNNLVSDMRSLSVMAEVGAPVVFDATHSVMQPGGRGTESGGDRKFVNSLARAAVSVGVAAVFMETHQDPDNAPSDGAVMLPLSQMEDTLTTLIKIDNIIKNK